jgi:hypothetical protein
VPGVAVAVTTGEGPTTAIRQPFTTSPLYLFLEDGIPVRATGFFNHNALYETNLPQAGGVDSASPDTIKAMPPEMLFDYLAVRLNGPKAAGKKIGLKHGDMVRNPKGGPVKKMHSGRDRAALVKFSTRAIAGRGEVQNRHIQTNTMIHDQTETTAGARSYLLVMQTVGGGAPAPGLTSVYEDDLVKTAAGWRIKERRAVPDRKGVLPRRAEAGAEIKP